MNQLVAQHVFFPQDVEKLRASGGATSFNLFLLREVETMNTLLEEIRSSLQVIDHVAIRTNSANIQKSELLQFKKNFERPLPTVPSSLCNRKRS